MKTPIRSLVVLFVLLASLSTPLFAVGSEYSQGLGVQGGRLAGLVSATRGGWMTLATR